MNPFQNKRVLLGVTGGIAAYKAAELVRLLVKAGAEVHVVMTRNAAEFVTPLTFQTLSGNPVHTELFNLIQEQEIGHISLADRSDLVIVAPATANLIGKAAHGLADDLLTTTLLATRAPVLFVPAMNSNMWDNPLYRRNQATLEEHGYHFMAPVHGALACGWEGQGKLPDPEAIVDFARPLVGDRQLAGRSVLVTAGPTREELDPVRYLSNYSSGKMGFALARAARDHGAEVVLVTGPVGLADPQGVETLRVTSAVEMEAVVLERAEGADIVIKAAAVADYRPRQRQAAKIKKQREQLDVLELDRNPDILAELGRRKRSGQVLVGFAAETEDLVAHAQQKLADKRLDLVVANDVTAPGAGFDVDTNCVRLLFADGRERELPEMEKGEVAEGVIQAILELL